MCAIFKEERVTQPLYRQASLHRLRGFLSSVRAVLREWRERKNAT
jgi:hypothetical protein